MVISAANRISETGSIEVADRVLFYRAEALTFEQTFRATRVANWQKSILGRSAKFLLTVFPEQQSGHSGGSRVMRGVC